MKFKKLLSTSILLGSILAAGSASAVGVFPEFTVNETVVPGANVVGAANPALVADKLNGSYVERLTITGANTFAAQGFATFSEYLSNDGVTPVASLLSNLEAFGGYLLVAFFNASGSITGPNEFSSGLTSFGLYVDPLQNTSASFAAVNGGVVAPTRVNDGDDILVATSNTGFGTGNLNGPPGAFNIDYSKFTLTAYGASFFTNPNPFYMNVRVNGDYDIVTPVAGDPNTRNITGDVSAVFQVPEPSSIALLGLAMLGVAVARRRKA